MITYNNLLLGVFVPIMVLLGQTPESGNDFAEMIEELEKLVATQSQQGSMNTKDSLEELKKIADQGRIFRSLNPTDGEKDGAIRELVLTLAKIPGSGWTGVAAVVLL